MPRALLARVEALLDEYRTRRAQVLAAPRR
jgi:hypothetical protein